MRLALAMGRPDVDRMLTEMSCAAFQEWCSYAQVEPFGALREDFRAGVLATVMAAPYSRTSRSPADFFSTLGDGHAVSDPDQQLALFEAFYGKGGKN